MIAHFSVKPPPWKGRNKQLERIGDDLEREKFHLPPSQGAGFV